MGGGFSDQPTAEPIEFHRVVTKNVRGLGRDEERRVGEYQVEAPADDRSETIAAEDFDVVNAIEHQVELREGHGPGREVCRNHAIAEARRMEAENAASRAEVQCRARLALD